MSGLRKQSLGVREVPPCRAKGTARETKRLDGVTRGPLYSAVGDVADGLATLRAHRQQRRPQEKQYKTIEMFNCGKERHRFTDEHTITYPQIVPNTVF